MSNTNASNDQSPSAEALNLLKKVVLSASKNSTPELIEQLGVSILNKEHGDARSILDEMCSIISDIDAENIIELHRIVVKSDNDKIELSFGEDGWSYKEAA